MVAIGRTINTALSPDRLSIGTFRPEEKSIFSQLSAKALDVWAPKLGDYDGFGKLLYGFIGATLGAGVGAVAGAGVGAAIAGTAGAVFGAFGGAVVGGIAGYIIGSSIASKY